jgi:ribosomal protein S18 acetylase RimI-like enzyme
MTFGKGVSNATRLYLVDLTSEELQARLIEALNVYVEAMGYPRGTEELRAWMWLELDPAGADATPSPAQIAAGRLVGIGYGYRGAPDQWWQQQVAAGLRRSQVPEETVAALLNSYFELTELHIRPGAQGRGLGEALARRLLGRRPESNVLLSTPEIDAEDNRAWRLYRRLGFTDVIRGYRFPGDPRPFAVLGRSLPL